MTHEEAKLEMGVGRDTFNPALQCFPASVFTIAFDRSGNSSGMDLSSSVTSETDGVALVQIAFKEKKKKTQPKQPKHPNMPKPHNLIKKIPTAQAGRINITDSQGTSSVPALKHHERGLPLRPAQTAAAPVPTDRPGKRDPRVPHKSRRQTDTDPPPRRLPQLRLTATTTVRVPPRGSSHRHRRWRYSWTGTASRRAEPPPQDPARRLLRLRHRR